MPGPLGTPCNSPEVDSETLARTSSRTPGIIGQTMAQQHCSQSKSGHSSLIIHLDLKDLIEIEQPMQGKVQRSGKLGKVDVFVKGAVLQKDVDRPKKILSIVRKIFAPLADVIKIELDTPEGSDRLLRAHFGWPLVNKAGKPQVSNKHGQFYDPSYVGAGAIGRSRSRVDKFTPVRGDANKGVTAYVFEGAIGIVIMDFFGGKVNVENVFATAIAHELGHNLGLTHSQSPGDMMFVYAGKSEKDQKRWMTAAEKNTLRFNTPQITLIRNLVRTPSAPSEAGAK